MVAPITPASVQSGRPPSENTGAARPRRSSSPAQGDTLGIAWIHGTMHVTAFRRQTAGATWVAANPIKTVEEFATALDEAIEQMRFGGTEAFLILAHEQFGHQMESTPAFSESAARSYLRSRIERHESDHGPVLWVSQRAESVRKDGSYIVHILPSAFYYELNHVMIRRRLDLTRILPLLVPLQLEFAALGEPADQPVLLAADAGGATAVMAGRGGRDILFARTTLASWRTEPARVAVEINRSLLYAKQQFAATIERIWLLGDTAEMARAEVEAKCGAGKSVSVQATSASRWLELVARLSQRHPVNLVAGYLRQKRRNRMLRRFLIAGAFALLVLTSFDAWNRAQAWHAEEARYAALGATGQSMNAEFERLTARNAELERDRAFVHAVVDNELPPVPGKFAALVATLLPREAHLTEFVVKWDDVTDRWTFRLDGTIEADEDTARTSLANVRRQLTRSPLRVHFVEQARQPATTTIGPEDPIQRFSMEGGIFED